MSHSIASDQVKDQLLYGKSGKRKWDEIDSVHQIHIKNSEID